MISMRPSALADEIGVLRDGHLEQWDTATTLSPAVVPLHCGFCGRGVFLFARVVDAGCPDSELGPMALERAHDARAPGDEIELLLRPDDVIHDDASTATARSLPHFAARSSSTHWSCRAAGTCWRWCPATTITASARRSAFASSWTTSSRSDARSAPTPCFDGGPAFWL